MTYGHPSWIKFIFDFKFQFKKMFLIAKFLSTIYCNELKIENFDEVDEWISL